MGLRQDAKLDLQEVVAGSHLNESDIAPGHCRGVCAHDRRQEPAILKRLKQWDRTTLARIFTGAGGDGFGSAEHKNLHLVNKLWRRRLRRSSLRLVRANVVKAPLVASTAPARAIFLPPYDFISRVTRFVLA